MKEFGLGTIIIVLLLLGILADVFITHPQPIGVYKVRCGGSHEETLYKKRDGVYDSDPDVYDSEGNCVEETALIGCVVARVGERDELPDFNNSESK